MRANNKKKMKSFIPVILLLLAAVLFAAAVMVRPAPPAGGVQPGTKPNVAPVPQASHPQESVPQQSIPESTATQPAWMDLGYGLKITDWGKYTGMYMEDGSNEVLADVMMIVVENNGDQDIQLAEIAAEAESGSYAFQLTNLAVGERAVLLDLGRKASTADLTGASIEKVALFEEPMSLCEDQILVSGMDGMVNVQNISDEDITGEIYVYYKYAAEDIYYGGITFRIRVEGGLKAGEIRQIPAGHYNAGGCAVVQVTVYD